jgi:glucose/arabinose dehydrogenase
MAGAATTPGHRSQSKTTLLGKMLRVDVSVSDADAKGYRIPGNNPFVDGVPVSGALGEIWAFGLRNPWKFSFDDPARGGTGGLFIGDVGQSSREEKRTSFFITPRRADGVAL